jgi:magnesium chelatase family protein
MLIGAVNPTPRGTAGSDEASRKQMERYLGRLSGPLIDRIDLHVEVPAVPHEQLSSAKRGTDSEALRGLVSQARDRQRQRHGSGLLNAGLSGRQLDQWVVLDPPAQRLLREAMTSLGLSARAYDKIRRVARTLADLEGAVQPTMAHIAEAIQYRLLDRQV